MKVNEGGGLDNEHENIEVIEMLFSEAVEMVKNKGVVDAKTILLLQYAQINQLF